MSTGNDFTRLVDDLAGHWTEPALKILKSADVQGISVDMEVETWRTLKKVLRAELRWQRLFRVSTLVSLRTLMEQTLRKAILLLAQKFAPQSVSYGFESRISQWAGERRATEAERGIYSALVERTTMRVAYGEFSRSDFLPQLRFLASSN